MARISLDPPKTLSYRIGTRFARRRYGVMPDPVTAMAHNVKVGRSYALFELGVERWRTLDRGLKDLAVMARPPPSAAPGAWTSATGKPR